MNGNDAIEFLLAGATAITLAAKAPSGIVIFGPIVGSIINAGTEAQATRFEPTALDTLPPSANERGPRYLFEARVVRSTGKQATTSRGTLTVQDNIDLSQSFNVS